jgi:hypothetical protein
MVYAMMANAQHTMTSKHKQATHTLSTNEQYLCLQVRTTQVPREAARRDQQGQKEPEVEQDMYMHIPSPSLGKLELYNAMTSAHERAAYLRQHPNAAAIQWQAAEIRRTTTPSEDE